MRRRRQRYRAEGTRSQRHMDWWYDGIASAAQVTVFIGLSLTGAAFVATDDPLPWPLGVLGVLMCAVGGYVAVVRWREIKR